MALMDEKNPTLAELGVGNEHSFYKRTKGLGQHDSVKIKNLGNGENTINITGTQGQSPDDIPDQTGINDWDDEFEGTSIDTGGTRRTGAKAWAWENQGTSTLIQGSGRSVMAPEYSVTDRHAALLQEAPSPPWKFRCKVFCSKTTAFSNYFRGGMVAFNNANDNIDLVAIGQHSGGVVTTYSATDLNSGSVQHNAYPHHVECPMYLEIEDDATDLHLRFSGSGVEGTFTEIWEDTAYATLGATPTHVGIIVGTVGVSETEFTFEWWRRIS